MKRRGNGKLLGFALLTAMLGIGILEPAGVQAATTQQTKPSEKEFVKGLSDEEKEAYELTKKYEKYLMQDDRNIQYPGKYLNAKKKTLKKSKNNSKGAEVTIPSAYDSRNDGLETSVKDQGTTGTCWAHGILDSAQSGYMAKNGTAQKLDLSEWQLSYFEYQQPVDLLSLTAEDTVQAYVSDWDGTYEPELGSLEYYNIGGNSWLTMFGMAKGIGTSKESDASFSTLMKALNKGKNATLADEKCYLDNDYRLDSVEIVGIDQTELLKQMIMEHGAGAISYYSDDYCYDYEEFSFYSPWNDESSSNHMVSVVGWDDNYPKENFVYEPEHDGAWLVKNSWGEAWGNDGYFWISYDEPSIKNDSIFFYDIEKVGSYDNVYQYDGTISTCTLPADYTKMANVFTVKQTSETLKAVSFYTLENDTNYQVDVYTDLTDTSNPQSGTKVATVSGSKSLPGYCTVKLSDEVSLTRGQTFAVVVSENVNGNKTTFYVDQDQEYSWIISDSTSEVGQSFVYDGSVWTDISADGNSNIRVKAFTTVTEEEVEGELVFEKDSYDTKVNLSTALSVRMNGVEVNDKLKLTFKVADSTIASVDGLGNVYGKKAGTTEVTVTYGSQTTSCQVNVTADPVTSLMKPAGYATKANPLKVYVGQSVALTCTKEPAYGVGEIEWLVSSLNGDDEDDYYDTSVINGKFYTNTAGTYRVTAGVETENGEMSGVEYYIQAVVDSVDCGNDLSKLESEHPYGNNLLRFYTYKINNNADKLRIHFSEDSMLETGYDYVYVYEGTDHLESWAQSMLYGGYFDFDWTHSSEDEEDEDDYDEDDYDIYQVFTGSELAGNDVIVNGNSFTVVLMTDEAKVDYGFQVDSVEALQEINTLILEETSYTLEKGETLTLQPTFTPETANEGLYYESSNQAVATVDENGVITANKIGTAQITITGAYSGKTVEATVTVTGDIEVPEALTFEESELNLTRNDEADLVIKENVEDLDIIYTSSAPGKVVVDEKTGHIIAAGVVEGATVTASADVNGVHLETSATVTVKTPDKMTRQGMQSIHDYVDGMDETYTYTAADGNNCIKLYFDRNTYLAGDGDYIEITDADGKLIGTYKGYDLYDACVVVSSNAANIHLVTQAGDFEYDNDEDDYDDDEYYDDEDDYYEDESHVGYGFRIKRIAEGMQTESISLADITLDLTEYDKCSAKLKPVLEPAGAVDVISYKIENEDVAYIDAGAVYAVSNGTTVITATTSTGLSATATIEVEGVPIDSFSIQDENGAVVTNLTMTEYDELEYQIKVEPEDYTEGIRVVSDDEDVVGGYVSQGVLYISAGDAGETTITVSSYSGGYSQTIHVTVEADKGTDMSDKAVDLTSFDDFTDGNQGKAPSDMTLNDFQSGHPYANDLKIMWSYYNENAETIEITFSSNTLFEDEYDYLCIYDYDGKAIGAYTYKQLADKTITINGKGFRIALYTDVSEQEYGFALTNLTVKPAAKDSGNVNDKSENSDKNNHNGNSGSTSGSSSGTQNVKVTKISLKGLSHNLAPNKKMSLKATVTPSNASNKGVTYKCSNTRYATVSSSGVVKAKKKGAGKTVTITATAKDGSGKKVTYKIKISKKAVKSIKVTAPKTAKAGKKVKLKTTVTPKKGAYTKVAYKCLTPKYASVSAKGVVKIKKSAKGKTVKIQVKTLDGTNKKKVVKIKVNKK